MSDRSITPSLLPMVCIVGAPRCGTTTLSDWMRRRPEICFSKVKEPHFFTLVDLTRAANSEMKRIVENDYVRHYFSECGERTRMLGEGSVSYLYAPERLLPMIKIWPGAKFVIALRDPFEMLPSVHQRLLFQGDETITDFKRAWELQEARAQGRDIPKSCIDARQLQYAEVVRLGKHVGHFLDVIGRERCYFSLFDDLRANPTAAYLNLMHFLGLEDDGFRDFRRRRASRGFRYGALQRILKRPSALTGSVLAGEVFRYRLNSPAVSPPSLFFRLLMKLRSKLLQWNERPATNSELPTDLKPEIRELLRDDVLRLSRLIGRDLSHWLGGLSRSTDARYDRGERAQHA